VPSPATLTARAVHVAHGARVVLDGIDLVVGPDARLGIVGPNGAGKTTLLRVLAGLVVPDRGTVALAPPTATVGYLPQSPERSPDETLRAFLARRTGVTAAEAALDAASDALARRDPGADDAYAAALDRWMALGGADLEARVESVGDDVGLSPATLDLPTAVLSGGQAARASLAAVLLSRFDVFLLDEPTNDLDFAGLDRLERFLAEVDGAVVIVSHDREFLDRTITSVFELDAHSHRGALYAGGWSAYLEARATARRHAEEAFSTWKGQRDDLADRARTQRQWGADARQKARKASTDGDKHLIYRKAQRTEKQASKVKITEKAIERLDREAVDKPWEGWELRFTIASAPRAGDVVVRLEGVVVERGAFRLGPVDLDVGWGDRVVIAGPNGSGKSTLLGVILGRLPVAAGRAVVGPSVVVGELDQARARFETDQPLLAVFEDATGLDRTEARTLLAKFGLGPDQVDRTTASLSPGERTRALLAAFQARGVNLLVLDEPTNHLDLEAIEQLEQALDTYDGTLLLVTHDRRLLEEVRVTHRVDVDAGQVAVAHV
jgi:ATPase subunit of ABC transporter with duplicated ATPase domains